MQQFFGMYFEKIELRTGTIIEVGDLAEARKPAERPIPPSGSLSSKTGGKLLFRASDDRLVSPAWRGRNHAS